MDKFVTRKPSIVQGSSSASPIEENCRKKICIGLSNLLSDPGLREKISTYHPNDQEAIRRFYLQKGPCQPASHNFPSRLIGGVSRRFVPSWFEKYKNWLEYSIDKDAIFCLYCYLFRSDANSQFGGDAFVKEGFSTWNKMDRLQKHVGDHKSAHYLAWKKCEALMNQKQQIESVFHKHSEKEKNEYRIRLGASIDCVKFLMRGGLPFRGHDESEDSISRGNFLDLKTLILRENESAFYVHCFAHQLQLTLVAVAKNHIDVAEIFRLIACVVNVVGGSCKRVDILRDTQANKVLEALDNGDLQSGRGLNQETSIKRAGDTRWGSHHGTILNLILMFSSVIDVLEFVVEDAIVSEQSAEARSLMNAIQTFEFAFGLHLMKKVLGITNELSLALQKKNQDIVIAMQLVKASKQRLQMVRDDGWNSLIAEITLFCGKHDILMPNMEDVYVVPGRPRRKAPQVTILHHYRVELFCTVIDMQLQELNNRFTEVNTELLICVACLNPSHSFCSFDKERLICLAKFYPSDFSPLQHMMLDDQLENYIVDVRSCDAFMEVIGLGDLSKKLVETKRDVIYPLVYLLVKLALLLPIATATVERAFSAMKYVKSRLCSRMGDQWLNDRLVAYIEKEVFDSVDLETIMQRFQNMRPRQMQL